MLQVLVEANEGCSALAFFGKLPEATSSEVCQKLLENVAHNKHAAFALAQLQPASIDMAGWLHGDDTTLAWAAGGAMAASDNCVRDTLVSSLEQSTAALQARPVTTAAISEAFGLAGLLCGGGLVPAGPHQHAAALGGLVGDTAVRSALIAACSALASTLSDDSNNTKSIRGLSTAAGMVLAELSKLQHFTTASQVTLCLFASLYCLLTV